MRKNMCRKINCIFVGLRCNVPEILCDVVQPYDKVRKYIIIDIYLLIFRNTPFLHSCLIKE